MQRSIPFLILSIDIYFASKMDESRNFVILGRQMQNIQLIGVGNTGICSIFLEILD